MCCCCDGHPGCCGVCYSELCFVGLHVLRVLGPVAGTSGTRLCTAAAAASTASAAKENQKRSEQMFRSTEELMKFQFLSMSMSYFSSLNMLSNLREVRVACVGVGVCGYGCVCARGCGRAWVGARVGGYAWVWTCAGVGGCGAGVGGCGRVRVCVV